MPFNTINKLDTLILKNFTILQNTYLLANRFWREV